MIQFKMTGVQSELCKTAMNGEAGEVLLDVVTDQIVLSDALTAEQKEGAGIVLKFLRDLHSDSDNFIPTIFPKEIT